MRVSEIITEENIKSWEKENVIIIKAGCGQGKSYFIKNILYKVAKEQGKKILFLIHRTNCVNQFQKEIERDNKTDVIDIKTYQHLEAKIKNKRDVDLSEYGYIVSDEFHYFLGDAAFNKVTDISLNLILGNTSTIKIFMSATGDDMKRYINNIKKVETIDYELPITYNFIESLTFFKKDETLEKFIEEAIENKQKGIFFIQSAKKAYELSQKYKDHCLFNCSKNNVEYYKYVDEEKINKMLEEERFEELIFITTTCMDAGVNINDTEVKHIVIDVQDKGVLIQCLGRRRIQNEDDKIYVHVKTMSNLVLGGKIAQLRNRINMADFFRKHTVKEFVEEYPRECDKNNIVYDVKVEDDDKCTKKLNELMYFKCKLDIIDFECIMSNGKYGYNAYISNMFGIERYRLIEEKYKQDELEKYLESIVGKRLYKDEQKELIEKVDLKQNGKLLKSYTSLNVCFEERKIKYEIQCVKAKKGEKLHWIVQKIEENKEIQTLEQYIEDNLDKKLFEDEQKVLFNLVINKLIKEGINYKGNTLKIKTLQVLFKEQFKLSYIIERKREDKIVDEKRIRRNYIVINKIEK